jgi:hypothetical protein
MTDKHVVGADALETAAELLHGGVDLHMHTAPDIYPRSVTTVEAAEQARDAGMRAIVVKSHSTDTAARAELTRELTGFPVYGGISLNYPVGGFNPHAVLESARQGGRIVWLPTTSARRFLVHAENVPTLRAKSPLDMPGLVATRDGGLVDGVEDVLRQIAEHGMILASGHLAPDETLVVFRRARELGVRRMVVTHPHADFIGASIEEMQELGELGAKNEMHYAFTTAAIDPPQDPAWIAQLIRDVGLEHCFLATDGGQAVNPPPVEMLQRWIAALLELGFDEGELRPMVADTPLALLAADGNDG